MEYRQLGTSSLIVSRIIFGTWAFGGDVWWGKQEDKDSVETLGAGLDLGITTFDTAPVYGRGRSEKIIGDFVRKRNLRAQLILATKLGLSWQGSKINHDLRRKRMLEEADESRQRLQTDYFDLYQVHWPDPKTPIGETAETMHRFYTHGIARAVGVSNYSIDQMKEFMRYCPLHSLQPEYSMFKRDIEKDTVAFCMENNIGIISYAPLFSGLLTGKFFLDSTPVPDDLNRRLKSRHFQEPLFSINKEALSQLAAIASAYRRTPAELAIAWNYGQPGITASIVGSRSREQAQMNARNAGWKISDGHMDEIRHILDERDKKIAHAKGHASRSK